MNLIVSQSTSDFIYIDQQTQLVEYCNQAKQAKVLALDTEFVRTRTLNAQLGLIQVFDGNDVALIDPSCELDLEPFWQLLTDQNIVKVLHSCHEDLEVFRLYAQRLPTPLFDTQIAGQFLNKGKVSGFGALVEQELGIVLDKGEARTNWLKRPLTAKQLTYAANDVKYLLPLYHKLNEQLTERGLAQYNLAEAALKVTQKQQAKNTEQLFLDFGTAWQLSPRQLAVLQSLAKWRLELAQKKDLALGFVAKDATLITLAQKQPKSLSQINQLQDINPHELRVHGKAFLKCIQQGQEVAEEKLPVKVPRLTDFVKYKQAYKAIKQGLTVCAEKAGVPIELLATKKIINQWIHWQWQTPYCQQPDLSQPWRFQLVADYLAEWQQQYQLNSNSES